MKHYKFIDYATQGYMALVAAIILLLHGDAVPAWGWYIGAHLLCLGLVHWLIHATAARPAKKVLDFLRHFYPVLLYTGFYREAGELNQMLVKGYADAVFIHWDQVIFGFQPSFEFMRTFPSVWVSEVFYLAYFSYYIMITGVGLALFLRNRTQFFHYLSVVSFAFYGCYLTYIFLPVIGPRIIYTDIGGDFTPPPVTPPAEQWVVPESVQNGPFFQVMKLIYWYFQSPGAAVPSSHVAIALVTLYFTFRYLPKIRWVHLVFVVLLCLSTVYCRYHYAVDVVAGVLMTALLLPLGNRLYARYDGQR